MSKILLNKFRLEQIQNHHLKDPTKTLLLASSKLEYNTNIDFVSHEFATKN